MSLSAEGITKWFGATCANDQVDLHLTGGEVHGLLGQNGAGKSTLVGVLTGRYPPDAGRVVLDGVELRLRVRATPQSGIATVYQELMLVPSMTGLENIALALGLSADRRTRQRVVSVQDELDLVARLDVPVREMEVPERQRLELVRALCQRPTVLLLDEPTSLLPPTRVHGFLQGVKGLAERGLAVLLITHRLDEARGICDTITIMREGRVVARYSRDELPSNSELALTMIGTTVPELIGVEKASETCVLRVADLWVRDPVKQHAVESASFEVRAGEVLGVAGVDGNGQVELLEAIAGLRSAPAGTVLLHGEDISGLSSEERFRRGIQIISGDRRRHEIIPSLAISDHFEYVLGDDILARLAGVLGKYDVRPPIPALRADQLSGGNQQKMILARACERQAGVLLASYPMQGLDIQASVTVRELLLARAREGAAIVIASSDLDELLAISHRILVMSRGRVMGIQHRESLDREQLAAWFTGGEAVAT